MKLLNKLLLGLIVVSIGFVLVISMLLLIGERNPKPKTQNIVVPTTIKLGPIVRLHFASSGRFFCSGTIISNTRVLTAGHCAAAAAGLLGIIKDNIIVKSASGTVIDTKAKPLAGDSRTDQGMISGDFSLALRSTIVIDPAKNIELWKSSKLISCGFPFGGKLFCVEVKDIKQYNFGWAGSSYLYPGMSGGPVFDAKTGLIVGINSAVGEGLSLFATTLEIFNNLDVTP